jgi:hypothetical protein
VTYDVTEIDCESANDDFWNVNENVNVGCANENDDCVTSTVCRIVDDRDHPDNRRLRPCSRTCVCNICKVKED